MKIANPSVTLKDGLWYGYTVEVPEEPKQKSEFETKGGLKVFMGGDFGHSKRVAKYQAFLASANASLVKISNQEEVEKYVRIVNAWEAYKTTDKWNPTPYAIYKLDGYVMEATHRCGEYNSELTGCDTCGHDCYKPEKTATISPIQKQESNYIPKSDLSKAVDPKGYATAAVKILHALRLQIGVHVNEFAMPTLIQIMKDNIGNDNQEELWREVDRIFNVKWSYGMPDEVMQELKGKFTITRNP